MRFDARFVNLMVAMVVVQAGCARIRKLRNSGQLCQGVALRLNGDGDIMTRFQAQSEVLLVHVAQPTTRGEQRRILKLESLLSGCLNSACTKHV